MVRNSKLGGKAEAPLLTKEAERRNWKKASNARLQKPSECRVYSTSALYEGEQYSGECSAWHVYTVEKRGGYGSI